jgi:DNA-binding MarR family transcriptional regulator
MSRDKRELFDELIAEVRRSQSASARFDQAVADAIGLNRTDMRCVDVISRHGQVAAGELARETGLSTGAMTAALDRLERAGYARRVRDQLDRRRVLVELTPQTASLHRFYAAHQAESERLYDKYTAAEMELMLGFFRNSREFNEARSAELESGAQRRGGRPEPDPG